jgi:hypothetical protein
MDYLNRKSNRLRPVGTPDRTNKVKLSLNCKDLLMDHLSMTLITGCSVCGSVAIRCAFDRVARKTYPPSPHFRTSSVQPQQRLRFHLVRVPHPP